MPDALAGIGIQREQGVGEEIVAQPVGAVEIAGGRTGGDEDDAALCIHRHAGPVVGGAGVGPRVFRPCLVAEFAGMRNGVELPAQFAGADVVGADVAGRRGQRFGLPSAHYQQVFVNDAGAGEDDGLLCRIAAQIFAQIDAAVLAERRNRLAGAGIRAHR